MQPEEKKFKSLSREYITKSMLSLMAERPFKEITISEITDHADIARRTFYLNYLSKEDVLDQYFEILFNDFLKSLNNSSASLFDKAKLYFEFWEQKYDFLLSLEKNQLFNRLIKVHVEKLVDQNIFNPQEDLGKSFSKREIEILVIFNSNGLCAMLEYWINNGMQESPEEMATIFQKIVNSK